MFPTTSGTTIYTCQCPITSEIQLRKDYYASGRAEKVRDLMRLYLRTLKRFYLRHHTQHTRMFTIASKPTFSAAPATARGIPTLFMFFWGNFPLNYFHLFWTWFLKWNFRLRIFIAPCAIDWISILKKWCNFWFNFKLWLNCIWFLIRRCEAKYFPIFVADEKKTNLFHENNFWF